MTDPAWHTHPRAPRLPTFDRHWVIYGRQLQPGDVIAEGDLFDADVGWLPSSLTGVPVSSFTRTTYVRPCSEGEYPP